MRLKNHLNESTESKIQAFVNQVSKEYKVPSVPVKFVNQQLKGSAFYQWSKLKSGKTITPINITIPEWQTIKSHPDEWQERLSHELAHHIQAQSEFSLRHNKKHENLSNILFTKLQRQFKPKDNRTADKLKYWLDNKAELIQAHGETTYNKEIKLMKNRLT
jgi:hypothetical protein